MNEFGEYLREKRESKKMTKQQLADKAEVSSSLISRIEKGERGAPKPETLRKIAGALEISYEEIMEKAGHINKDSLDQFSLLNDIDAELVNKFTSVIREDPYQSLFFDDILSASKEEREQIVREWLELRRKFRKNKQDQ